MKSLKPIGNFLIKCFGSGILYGTTIGIGIVLTNVGNHMMSKDSRQEGYVEGIKVGRMIEQNKNSNNEIESE